MRKNRDRLVFVSRALAWGLAGGLFFAALDPVMAGILKAALLRDRGPAGLIVLEGAALLFYVVPSLAVSLLIFLAAGKDRGPVAAGAFFLAAAAWIASLSMLPGQTVKGLILIGSSLLAVAVPSGVAGARLGVRFKDLSPAQAAGSAVLGYCLALAALNFSVSLVAASEARFLLRLISAVAVAAAAAGAWVYLVMKGSSRLGLGAAIAASAIAVIVPFAAIPSTPVARPVEADPGADAPHLILIVADALRYDAVTPERAPNLARFMQNSARFGNARSPASWTVPAMAGIMSARDPERLKLGVAYRIPGRVPLLAEDLTERGYRTSAIVANKVISPDTGILRGFQRVVFLDHLATTGDLIPLQMLNFLDHYGRVILGLSQVPDTTPEAAARALRELEKPDRPLFLYLHFMDPHEPYSPPLDLAPKDYRGQLRYPFHPNDLWHVRGDYANPQIPDLREGRLLLTPEDKKFVSDLYLAEVVYVDRAIGQVIEAVQKLSGRPVIIVFVSDHGEELWDHGDWGHGHTMYEELLHVPLALWRTGAGAREIVDVVTTLSLMPTLRELLGLGPDPEAMAPSLAPLIDGDPWGPAPPCFSSQNYNYHPLTAVRQGDHKVVHDLTDDTFTYYNLAADPAERSPRDADGFAPAAPLVEILKKHEAAVKAASYHTVRDPAAEEKARRLLKAVGYIQ